MPGGISGSCCFTLLLFQAPEVGASLSVAEVAKRPEFTLYKHWPWFIPCSFGHKKCRFCLKKGINFHSLLNSGDPDCAAIPGSQPLHLH